MTNPARAREILDSYGADAVRWPVEEREAVLATIRGDAGLRAHQSEAARLDIMLGEWARRDLGSDSDAGAAAARVLRPARPWRRWAAGGGGLAAALAAVMLIGGPTRVPIEKTATTPAATTVPLTAAGAFSTLFTTTPDEEDVL